MTTIDQLGNSHNELGLFSGKQQTGPDVKLEPREDGTFLFPPTKYDDMAHYVDFWMKVPISDAVLSNITAGHADLVRRQLDAASTDWAIEYDIAHRKELTTGSDDAIRAAKASRELAHDEFVDKYFTQHPQKIRPVDARSIARAGQLSYHRAALSPNEEEAVHEATMYLRDGELSVGDIVDRYQLGELRGYFQDPEVTASERLEDLRLELRSLRLGD